MKNTSSIWVAALASAALLIGCSSQKEPATNALAAAESALAAFRDDAAKYAGNDLAGIDATIGDLKAKLAAGDYKGILAAAPDLTSKIGGLKDMVGAKKAEMEAALAKATTDWGGLSTDLPQMLQALQSRVDALSASKRLPPKLDAAKFDSAKSGLAALKSNWEAASAAFASGNVLEAVSKAQAAKTAGTDAMTALGMNAG
jgi:hypothetical protein